MREISDAPERRRVLTDLESTLLVEAAAGTGKTALIAGRLTMLLARGTDPRNIAAITFTELAAGELAVRLHRYVEELLAGRVPRPLRLGLPNGLNAAQREALAAAALRLDELTATTIHAFCQNIICSFSVEADVDPGAQMLDATQASAMFNEVFEHWMRRRLKAQEGIDNPIVALSKNDPRNVAKTLYNLARFRLQFRSARTVAPDLDERPDIELIDAIAAFRSWVNTKPRERETLELVGQLETLGTFFTGHFDGRLDFATLWKLVHPPKLRCMRWNSYELLKPRLLGRWQTVAGRERGTLLNSEVNEHFDRVDGFYRALLGHISSILVSRLSVELDQIVGDYSTFKRAAAVLDFADLLEKARTLVRQHRDVRRELNVRFQNILVDEFQDTDPVQAEILFRIASEEAAEDWKESPIRPGALFMVGDPKQAIYRFRGADIGAYEQVRVAISRERSENIVQVTSNFRSRPNIVRYVNRCFAAALSSAGQPGYVPLTSTLEEPNHAIPSAAKIAVNLQATSSPAQMRDAEADTIADVCLRLVGNLHVYDEKVAGTRALNPSDIALLAPTGTELWRYERALEARGLLVASQAGKNFFRRQEVQDLVALTRVLADSSDTIAFLALMRGPLIGLTLQELLDIAESLPQDSRYPDRLPRFHVLTPTDQVSHPHAKAVLSLLQDLRRRAWITTPELLLAEAIERLAVRPILAARDGSRSSRSAANVEAFLERARSFNVRGLKKFARDISREWSEVSQHLEGRVDSEGDAIELITIHSAKGLEWPVVIPINTSTLLRHREPFVYRASDETLHWIVGDVVPPGLHSVLDADEASQARERERLLYVACTRARELLLIPELLHAKQRSWSRVLDLGLNGLPAVNLSGVDLSPAVLPEELTNTQTVEVFRAERASIETAIANSTVTWVQPSDGDLDRSSVIEATGFELESSPDEQVPVGAGRIRGLIMHKLIEEALTGELEETVARFTDRAEELLKELESELPDNSSLPSPEEMAKTAWRTLHLPDVAAIRDRLVPEWTIYRLDDAHTPPSGIIGRIDAIAYRGSEAEIVLDWKSDISPTEADMLLHQEQMKHYLRGSNARAGAIVYMTAGTVRWIFSNEASVEPYPVAISPSSSGGSKM